MTKSIYPLIVLGLLSSTLSCQERTDNTIPRVPNKYVAILVDSMYDTATITVKEAIQLGIRNLDNRNMVQEVKVSYPKVLMVRDENVTTEALTKSIIFLDRKGNVNKEVSLQRYSLNMQSPAYCVFTRNKKYLYVYTPLKEDAKSELILARTDVYDATGNFMWSAKHKLSYVYLSPNGKYFIGMPTEEWDEGPISIYNREGIVKKISKKADCIDVDFSEDGSFFAVVMRTTDNNIKSDNFSDKLNSVLVVYDNNGNELWRKENLSKGASSACDVKILQNNEIVVMTGVGDYRMLYFDVSGKKVKEIQGDVKTMRNFKYE